MNKDEIINRVNEVIESSKIQNYPVDVIGIAHNNGFRVYEQYLPQKVSGMIMVDKEKPIDNFGSNKVIVINKYDAAMRRRFTIAHELAHYFLQDCDSIKLYAHRDEGKSSSAESDANFFASNLLMPEKLLNNAINAAKDRLYGILPDSILEIIISDIFQVSLSAARIRLLQLKIIS
ncbi:MAG: ImmA/IrrE family metallo-endopeptidase [Bacillota bacterium]|nr:ImmA/IrrE family metallo-endopeptidase [Bacillota bacterium]